MIAVRRYALLSLVTTVACVGLSGCGSSDEEQIRATVNDWTRALESKDAGRACDLLGPRGEAQFTTLMSTFGGAGRCEDLVKRLDSSDDEERLRPRDVKTAKIAVRGDLATLTGRGSDQAVGMRRIDDEWRIDDLLDPSLQERPRDEARLTHGSDAQQIRATMTAMTGAVAHKDFARACRLMSYSAEAQIVVGGAFASMFATEGGAGESDARAVSSCPSALQTLVSLARDSDERGDLFGDLPTRAQIKTARVTVRGSRASVAVPGQSPAPMIRIDGRWLLDAEPTKAPTPADYERCWREAGATIASGPRELRFATHHQARHIAVSDGRISVKGADWRVFYTLPQSGDDPGLGQVLADPGVVATVAYVRAASVHPDVVEKARDCGA